MPRSAWPAGRVPRPADTAMRARFKAGDGRF